MSDVVIRVNNLSKRYNIGVARNRHDTLRDQLTEGLKSLFRRNGQRPTSGPDADRSDSIWALKDVSFEVKRGEVVGIIGRNGAGKSTLLKILSRITEPTTGYADIRGRLRSLLEVGTGFHGELTGGENIYLNGAILGMSKAEIGRKFDEIVAFSEVEKFINTPVKHYSSGMYVRLAFAVAAHLEPEILIVDEVLAVGDAAFQKKCLGKMSDVASHGKTVLFVSHNMAAIQALCSRGIHMSNGRIALDASAMKAVRQYSSECNDGGPYPLADRTDRSGDGRVRFTAAWMENEERDQITNAIVGQDVRFCFAYEAINTLRNVHVAFNLYEQEGSVIINCDTSSVGQDFEVVPERGVFICEIKKFPLRAARYTGNVICVIQDVAVDWVQNAFVAEVMDGDFYGTGKLPNQGRVLLSQEWVVQGTET
jgi:lipopolysaccharide transport system ATP-binding protein